MKLRISHVLFWGWVLICSTYIGIPQPTLKNYVLTKADLSMDNSQDEAAQIESLEYHIRKTGPVQFEAVNRQHNLRARISPGMYRLEDRSAPDNWYAQFRLAKIDRYDDHDQLANSDATSFQLSKEHLKIENEALTTDYINTIAGIRQNFILSERPSGIGNLKLSSVLDGPLVMQLTSMTSVAFFKETLSGPIKVFQQKDLKVWDALGKTISAWFEIEDFDGFQALSIIVDDKHAKYPLTIDPISTSADLLLIGPQTSCAYGLSVGTAGDINRDGYSDVVIGAPEYDNGQNNEGVVFVHYGSESGISATPDLTLEVNQQGARFGAAVSTAGDVNGDGYSDVLVGARNWESSGAELTEGSVFVYHGGPTGLNPVFATQLQPDHADDNFGAYVNTAGDLNGDGYSDIVVGAYLSAYPSYQEGSAFVYLGSATGVNTTFAHHLQSNQTSAHFSKSVSSAGDINGDGYSDLIVGAPRYDYNTTNDGALFVWFGGPGSLGGPYVGPDQIISPFTHLYGNYGWGCSTAGDVNGDGYSDVIVGAYRADDGETDEGMAFVHHGGPTGLDPVPATIMDSDQNLAWFGRCVSNAGDVNGDGYGDVIVGAPTYGNVQASEGATFVFLGSSSGVSSTPELILESNDAGGNMGESVSTAGDVNGDGYSDIIAGSDIYGNSGATFIYHGGPYGVSTIGAASVLSSTALEELGKSVAHAGDVNGDGFADVVVGIPNYSNGQTAEGAVEVYHGSMTGIGGTPDQLLESNFGNALFGSSVSTAGDVDGDGYSDIVVGAPGYSNGQPNEGAVYVYMGSPAGISGTPDLLIQGNQANAEFGSSVSKAGDINSDGYSDVIVGSPHHNGLNDGIALLFLGAPAGLNNSPEPLLNAPQANSGFGVSVNTAGDVNSDGFSDVIVGAHLYDNGQADEGAGFIYYGSLLGLSVTPDVVLERNNAGAQLGYSVSTAGDVNGDGYWDVIMGAPKWSNSGSTPLEGGAFVWHSSPAGFTSGSSNPLQRNRINAELGTSVSDAGDVNGDGYADVIVGAPYWRDGGQTEEGGAFIYHGGPTGISTVLQTTLQYNIPFAHFGASVHTAGDVNGDGYSDVIVGAPDHNGMGGAFLHLGNEDQNIFRYTRQYQSNLVDPLAVNSMDYSNPNYFGIGHFARSFTMRQSVQLEWEVVHEGQAFTGSPITNSTLSTGISAAPTDLGLTGVEIKELIYKAPQFIRHKWRVRVKYDPVLMVDGQPYSRWFYGFATGFGDIGVLPVELMEFTGYHESGKNHLHWVTATETDNDHFNVQRSSDASDFHQIGQVNGAGNSNVITNYEFVDGSPIDGTNYYRLEQVDVNGNMSYSDVISITSITEASLLIYPNPVDDLAILDLEAPENGRYTIQILTSSGKLAEARRVSLNAGHNNLRFNLSDYVTGGYILEVYNDRERVASTKFVKR